MKIYDDKAMDAYDKGDIKKGNKYEKISDKLYKDNYNKMFQLIKNK